MSRQEMNESRCRLDDGAQKKLQECSCVGLLCRHFEAKRNRRRRATRADDSSVNLRP
jgi:hypothetical protein